MSRLTQWVRTAGFVVVGAVLAVAFGVYFAWSFVVVLVRGSKQANNPDPLHPYYFGCNPDGTPFRP